MFLEAFVESSSLLYIYFARGVLVLCRLDVLLFLTSIHSSCQASSRWSTTGVDLGLDMLTAVNIGLFWPSWPAGLGLDVFWAVTSLCVLAW